MFGVDDRPEISDVEKLQYLYAAMSARGGTDEGQDGVDGGRWPGSVEAVRRGRRETEPYILVSRGDEFADSFDAYFFAKAFPTLFPFGRGGPGQAKKASLTV